MNKELISYFLNKNKSDKCMNHTYHYLYDDLLCNLDRNATLDILESGIEKGGSLCAWKEYFPNARVTGVDIIDTRLSQFIRDDVEFIVTDIKQYKPDRKFDLIIEDGNHSNEDALWAVINLVEHLKPNGHLVIEDVQEAYMVPFLSWGKLLGDYVVHTIDLRRLTNGRDNFLIDIHKVIVNREYGTRTDKIL